MMLPSQLNVWSRHAAINHLIPKILNKEGEFSNYLRVLWFPCLQKGLVNTEIKEHGVIHGFEAQLR